MREASNSKEKVGEAKKNDDLDDGDDDRPVAAEAVLDDDGDHGFGRNWTVVPIGKKENDGKRVGHWVPVTAGEVLNDTLDRWLKVSDAK